MLETILVILFTLFFAWVAWWKLDWAIVLCLVFLPTYLLRFRVGGLPMTVLEVMILVIVLVWGIKAAREWLLARVCSARLPWRWILLAWIVVGIVAVIISPDTRQALGLWKAYVFEPILFFVVFVNVIKTGQQIRAVIWAFGALVVVVGFVALLQYVGLIGIPEPYDAQIPMRATSVFLFPTAVGKLLGSLVAFFLALALVQKPQDDGGRERTLWQYIFPWGVIVFGAIALLLSFSRGAIIGVLAGIIFISFFSQWRKWLWGLIVLSLIVCLVVPFTRHEIFSIVSTKDTSADVHIVMWRGAVRIIKADPITGTGLASFPIVYEKYKEASHTEFFPNPDELYLTLWIEMGLAGLVVFLWLVVRYFKSGIALVKNQDIRTYAVGLLAGMIAILVHGFFDTPYFKNDLAVAFWVMVGLIVVLSKQKDARRSIAQPMDVK